jgi:hypothetical protein
LKFLSLEKIIVKVSELIGQKFGRLTVESLNPVRSLSGNTRWNCICDCGNKTTIRKDSLTGGLSNSCGCYQKERVTTHGMTGIPEYHVWEGMIQRCLNSDSTSYNNYGARGVTVCDRWLNSFEAFYEDMGPRPSLSYTLDRKENNLGYYKENCKWSTWEEQHNNRRNNVLHTHNGITKTIAEWAREYGVKYDKFYHRLVSLKWSFEKAANTP